MVIIIKGRSREQLRLIGEKFIELNSKNIIFDPMKSLESITNCLSDRIDEKNSIGTNTVMKLLENILINNNLDLLIPFTYEEYKNFQSFFEEVKKMYWEVYTVEIDSGEKDLEKVIKNIYSEINRERDEYVYNELLDNKLYTIRTSTIDLKAANSCHQTLNNIIKRDDTKELIIELHPMMIRQELEFENINKYLEKISDTSDDLNKILKNEDRENYIIYNVIQYLKEEYSNLNNNDLINKFVNIMRRVYMPTKYVAGISVNKERLFWVEVYVKNVGWVPIDVKADLLIDKEGWYFGITNRHIKFFEGIELKEVIGKIGEVEVNIN